MRIKKIALILLVGGAVVNNNLALANHKHHEESDGRIRKALDRTIDKYPNLDDDVNIKVKDGAVYLTGTVDNSAERQEAVSLASNINGVREVHDRLKVEHR